MRKIEVKDEDDLRYDLHVRSIRKNNQGFEAIQLGKYNGLSIHDAMNKWHKNKTENPDYDWSDEERDNER